MFRLIYTTYSTIIALGAENMIKTIAMLMDELKEYVNPTAKIRWLVEGGKLFPVVRGLYETDGSSTG